MSMSNDEPISGLEQYRKAVAGQQQQPQQPCRTCGTCPTCGNRPAPIIPTPPVWPSRPNPNWIYYSGGIVGASGSKIVNPSVTATVSTVPSSFTHKGVGPESQYTATNEASTDSNLMARKLSQDIKDGLVNIGGCDRCAAYEATE